MRHCRTIASGDAVADPGIGSDCQDAVFEAQRAESYTRKIKALLTGAPVLATELNAVQADPAALRGLVTSWLETPAFETKMIFGKNVKPSVVGGIKPVGNDFGAMGFDSTSGAPSDAADVPATEALESAAKTLGSALGIARDTLDKRILAGKVVAAAIQS